jgi:hypothetical protein
MAAIAIRTCIGCRGQFPKKALLRFVCNLVERLQTDPTGKLPGRGAYICRSHACICAAFKSHKRVNSLLRINLSKQVIDQFKQELLNLVGQGTVRKEA